MSNQKSIVATIHEEVNRQLANEEVLNSLIATTFNGLTPYLTKQAIVEGMMRGFKFENFLKKDVYAIPFKNKYSLITSIDYSRKIGMRSGIVGKKAPIYTYKADGSIDSCEITVSKKIEGYVGEFTSLIYFDEYYKKPIKKNGVLIKSLWDTKPRTMIAKVAEMHALRMACPEELAQAYIEEEIGKEEIEERIIINDIAEEIRQKMEAAESEEELKKIWGNCPNDIKAELESLKEKLKNKFDKQNDKKVEEAEVEEIEEEKPNKKEQ